jgi:hypothetical protein
MYDGLGPVIAIAAPRSGSKGVAFRDGLGCGGELDPARAVFA